VGHLAERSAILVGMSGGALAAILAAIHCPDVARAVVADSFRGDWTPSDIEALVASRGKMSLGQIAFWQKAHGSDWHSVVEADTAMIAGWRETGIDFFEGRIGEIECPVLLTASLADELIPRVEEEYARVAATLPHATTHLFDSGAHPAMWSRAEDFRRVVERFLEESPP
jgi:pimeloyl-ACP methyl ester carboxylesterase